MCSEDVCRTSLLLNWHAQVPKVAILAVLVVSQNCTCSVAEIGLSSVPNAANADIFWYDIWEDSTTGARCLLSLSHFESDGGRGTIRFHINFSAQTSKFVGQHYGN